MLLNIVGNITAIDTNQRLWYECCEKCHSSLRLDNQGKCTNCNNQANDHVAGLKIQVQVTDKTGDMNLTLFGEDASKVINIKIVELLQIMQKPNSSDELEEIVQRSLGKEYSFTIKVTEKNLHFALQNNFTECGVQKHQTELQKKWTLLNLNETFSINIYWLYNTTSFV